VEAVAPHLVVSVAADEGQTAHPLPWEVRVPVSPDHPEDRGERVRVGANDGPAEGRDGPTVRGDGLDEVARLWAGSAEDERLREHSHWRGSGAFADERRWSAIGERTRHHVDGLLREVHGEVPSSRVLEVLEWGPGGGSNLVALAPIAARFVGVDVSAPNLAECGRQAAAIGFDGFAPVHIRDSPPTVVLARVDAPVDVVVSTSVFQHFPSVAYGEQVLGVLRELSHPGTVGVVQVRYELRPDLEPATGRYRDDYLHGTVHPLADFWWSLDAAGLTPLRIVDLERASRTAWFLFRVDRDPAQPG
jgi:hypothetical protein